MMHFYAIVATPNIEVTITKGRTDYPQPQDNRSVRYSLDKSKVLIEGAFTAEENAWFVANALLVGDVSDVLAYIAANRVEWEVDSDAI